MLIQTFVRVSAIALCSELLLGCVPDPSCEITWQADPLTLSANPGTVATTTVRVASTCSLDSALVEVSGRPVLDGDLDGDGDIDQSDVNIVFAARGAASVGSHDARDVDRDGTITVIDARQLAVRCTNPDCALGSAPDPIAGLIRASEFFPARDGQNQAYDFDLVLEIPKGSTPSVFPASMRVRKGSEAIGDSHPLRVEIASPTPAVPPSVATPSSDRLTSEESGTTYVNDELVVMLDWDTPEPEQRIREIAAANGGEVIGSSSDLVSYQIRFPVNTLEALRALQAVIEKLPDVEAVSVNMIAKALATSTNDTEYEGDSWVESDLSGNNWNLKMIKAPTAWDEAVGDAGVIVGIVDNDFDAGHGDLAANVSSIDLSRRTVQDDHGTLCSPVHREHGTHVAGTACAVGNNEKGIAGVSWKCALRLHAVIGGNSSGFAIAAAMTQAVKDGSRIINGSFGTVATGCNCWGSCPDLSDPTLAKKERSYVNDANRIFRRPIVYARRLLAKGERTKDVLWVFAAGNEQRQTVYASPASLSLEFPDNVIAVAAVTRDRGRAYYSNWGVGTTVAAPGDEILSTLPRTPQYFGISGPQTDRYGTLSGTSMAAPHVTGLAALVAAKHPEYDAKDLKSCIVDAANAFGGTVLPEGTTTHNFKIISAPEAVRCEKDPSFPRFAGEWKGALCSQEFGSSRNVRVAGTAPVTLQQTGPSISGGGIGIDVYGNVTFLAVSGSVEPTTGGSFTSSFEALGSLFNLDGAETATGVVKGNYRRSTGGFVNDLGAFSLGRTPWQAGYPLLRATFEEDVVGAEPACTLDELPTDDSMTGFASFGPTVPSIVEAYGTGKRLKLVSAAQLFLLPGLQPEGGPARIGTVRVSLKLWPGAGVSNLTLAELVPVQNTSQLTSGGVASLSLSPTSVGTGTASTSIQGFADLVIEVELAVGRVRYTVNGRLLEEKTIAAPTVGLGRLILNGVTGTAIDDVVVEWR